MRSLHTQAAEWATETISPAGNRSAKDYNAKRRRPWPALKNLSTKSATTAVAAAGSNLRLPQPTVTHERPTECTNPNKPAGTAATNTEQQQGQLQTRPPKSGLSYHA